MNEWEIENRVVALKLLVLFMLYSHLDGGTRDKQFYRTRGFQARGNIIKTVSFVSTSEDCLHECYVIDTCQSFNTIKIKKGALQCQLMTHDLCDLNLDIDLTNNPLASVYFSHKIEDCVKYKIFQDGRCLKRAGKNKKGLAITNDPKKCVLFTLMKKQWLTFGDECLHSRNSLRVVFVKINPSECISFKFDDLVISTKGRCFVLDNRNYFKRQGNKGKIKYRKVLHRLLELTKEFKLNTIAMQIDVLLSRQIIQAKEKQTVPTIVRDLYIADKHNLKATKIFCAKYLISADGEVDFEQHLYKKLSAETKLEILSERLYKFINTTKTYIPELNRSVVQFSRDNTSWEILKTLSSNEYR